MPSKEAKGFHILRNEAQGVVALKSTLQSCQGRPTTAARGASPESHFWGAVARASVGTEPTRGLHLAKARLEAAR